MKSARLIWLPVLAMVCVASIGLPVDAATAVRSSTHFRITYNTTQTTEAYAKFILKESERAWTAIFTTMGYKQPKWMKDRIKAGGKILFAVKPVGPLAVTSNTYLNSTKEVIRGKIDFGLRAKFTKGGTMNWDVLRATCGHEFFHLVQGGYDVTESKWLKETTATWIEDKIYPAEAKAKPTAYGFRFYLKTWDRHRRLWDLISVGSNHEYAASFYIQYLSEHHSLKNGVVKAIWDKAATVKGDNTAKAIALALGDADKWGEKTLKSIRGLSLTDLVRSSKRRKTFSLASLVKGPYYTPTLLSMTGLSVHGELNDKLRARGRTVAKLAFDCVNIKPDPLKVGSPVDIVLAARGFKEDGDWAFRLVKAPKKGTWKFKSFDEPTKNEWTSVRISNFDFRNNELFFLAIRTSATDRDKYRLTGMIITPPVIESFEVHAPPPPQAGDAASGLVRTPELVWAAKRNRWRSPVQGTGWRTEITPDRGIPYNEKATAEIRIVLNRPAPAGLTMKLGDKLSPALTAVGASNRKFRARVEIKLLKDFLDTGRIPVEISGKDAFDMGLDEKPWTAPQLEFKGTDIPEYADISKWEGADAPFAKPGGVDKLNDHPIPLYEPKKPAPKIVLLKLSRESTGEVFYHSEKKNFRPITGGKVDVQIAFADPMDTETADAVDISIRGLPAKGKFQTPNTWVGTIDVPQGGYAFSSVKGIHALSIQAKTEHGIAIDSDPDTDGDQPDTTHQVVIDGIPTYIESVEVSGMGEKYYDASWSGGPDLKKVENLSVSKIGDQRRQLNIRTTKELPADDKGTLHVVIRSSQPLSAAPSITLGSAPVTNITGDDKKLLWQGEVTMEAVSKQSKPGQPVPISISATDVYGNRLDADPRTVPALASKRPRWRGYESQRGSESTGYGGVDKWHEIGPAPKMSFIIVLDASGSMGEGGRMVNAKAGIMKLLDVVPKGVELAIVVFQGGSIRTTGFTTDLDTIRAAVKSASPSGGTPLANAIARARMFLESSSHPISKDWRYRIFSDGQETAGGNVVLQTRLLDQAVARRKGTKDKKPKDKIPPPKPVTDDSIPIYPQRWTRYAVKVDSRPGLDWIWLIEVKFLEKELPDGRCYVRLQYKSFGVAYGAITDADGSNKKIKWRINSSHSPKRSKLIRATSNDGKAAIERIRRKASELRSKTKTMQQCRQEIQENVQREVN